MYTTVVTMERKLKKIKLVGCVHVAPQEYYDRLQEELAEGLVLYEATKSKDNTTANPSDLIKLYKIFGDMTGYVFQREGLDYSNPEWINSDLDMEVIIASDPNFKSLVESDLPKAVTSMESMDVRDIEKFSFIFKTAMKLIPIVKFFKLGKSSHSLIGLRNDKVIIDTFEQMVDHNFITIAYGEAHLGDFIKKFKKFGFEVTEKHKVCVGI